MSSARRSTWPMGHNTMVIDGHCGIKLYIFVLNIYIYMSWVSHGVIGTLF